MLDSQTRLLLLHTILAQIKPGFPVCLQFLPMTANSTKPEIGRADRLVLALSLQQVDLQGESCSHLLTNAIMWTLGSGNKLTGQGTCVCVDQLQFEIEGLGSFLIIQWSGLVERGSGQISIYRACSPNRVVFAKRLSR